MPKTLQLRRGTTAEITANTPASGELFVDTEKKTVTVGDGSTAGGIILARNDRVSDVYNTANGANGLAAGAYDKANTASSNTVVIQGVDTWQNTQITQVNQFAQAAYNQANTGGGGGANTGNYTFSANTISLPDFSDASMNLVGLTTRSVPIYNYTGIPSGSASGEGYAFPPTGNFELNSTLEWISTYGVQLTLGNFLSPSINQALWDSVPYWNIGDTFDFVYAVGESSPYTLKSTTLTLTSKPVEYLPGQNPYAKYWRFNVDTVIPADRSQQFNPNSVAINNYPYKTNSTYTFKGSGEFISDSALIGDVLITDDIVTPLALDSYGIVDSTTTGTLTVNGNLNVTGTITGGKFESFASTTNIAEKYKTYLQGGVATSFTLPSSGEVGDWLQVICAGMNVVIPASTALTGFVSGSAGQTVNLGNTQKINLFVCDFVSGGTSYWRVYGLSQTPYTP